MILFGTVLTSQDPTVILSYFCEAVQSIQKICYFIKVF